MSRSSRPGLARVWTPLGAPTNLPALTDFDTARARTFLEKADIEQPDGLLATLRDLTDAELGLDAPLLDQAMADHGLPSVATRRRASHQGTFHRLYDVVAPGTPARLLRVCVFPGPAGATLMDVEARLVKQLREAGIPVPASASLPVAHEGEVRGTQVVERAVGTPLSTADEDELRMTALLADTTALLARVHAWQGLGYGLLSASPAGDLVGVHEGWDLYVVLQLDAHLAACEAHRAITPDESEHIVDLFERARPLLKAQTARLLHGDPGSHNVMIDGTRVTAMLDWEDALLGDPLFDLAALCSFHPERRHSAILCAYGLALRPGDEVWQRFWLYFLRIALARTVHRIRFAYPDRPDRAPAARRIQLALARLAGEMPGA